MRGAEVSSRTALRWLFAAWAALAIANALWVRYKVLPLPPPWDPALQQTIGLRVLEALEVSGWSAAWRELHDRSPFGPPFFPVSTIPLYLLFGEGRAAAHFTSSLYLGLHILAVFLLGRRVCGVHGGLLAAFLFSTFGAVIRLSRDYLHDFPAAAFLAVAFFFMLRSDGLTRPGTAAAFGLFAGLASVTKSMAAAFVPAPLLFLLLRGLREGRKPHLAALTLAAAAALLVALPWWGRHGRTAFWYLWHYGRGEGALTYAPAGESVVTPSSLAFYALALLNEGMSVPLGVLAVLLALLAWRHRGGATREGAIHLLAVWLLSAYLILTLSINKAADRYVIFLLAPVAVLLSATVQSLPPQWRRPATASLVAAGLLNYVSWTFAGSWAPPVIYIKPPEGLQTYQPEQKFLRLEEAVPGGRWPLETAVRWLRDQRVELKERSRAAYSARHDLMANPAQQIRSAFRSLLAREPEAEALGGYARQLGTREPSAVVAEIAHSAEFARRPLHVVVVTDHVFVNAATLNYYAAAARASVQFLSLADAPGPPWEAVEAAVVAEPGGKPGSEVRQRLMAPGSGFVLDAAYPCPDGRTLELFVLAPSAS